jgi:hypothetical protein
MSGAVPARSVSNLPRCSGMCRSSTRAPTYWPWPARTPHLSTLRLGPARAVTCVVLAAGRDDLIHDPDQVIANYLSMSFASPHLLAERLTDFVQDLRTLLCESAPNGRFWEWPGDTEMVLARRH